MSSSHSGRNQMGASKDVMNMVHKSEDGERKRRRESESRPQPYGVTSGAE